MNIRQLNEELQKFLEDTINELSYETKKSYLQKRKAQLDKAQASFDKANRLIRSTEFNKDPKRTLSNDKLKEIAVFIKEQIPEFKGTRFYITTYRNGESYSIDAGSTFDDRPNSCHISLDVIDKYLNIYIQVTDKHGKRSNPAQSTTIKISLNEFNAYKLSRKAVSEIKTFLKPFEKTENTKLVNKVEKAIENLKKLLSRFTKVDEDVFYKYGNYKLEDFKSFIKLPMVVLNSKNGYKQDYQIYGIGLTKQTDLIILYDTEIHKRNYSNLSKLFLSGEISAEETLKVCDKIQQILKGEKPTGRSTLKADQNKLAKKKEQAKEAIEEFKSAMKHGSYDKIDSIEENGNSYEFLTHFWGDWEGEDYDFQRPTDETRERISAICDKLQKKYPDLKFAYGVSEKHMLDCCVSWS